MQENVVEINPKLKLTHKDGGFIVISKKDYDNFTKIKKAYFTSQGYLEKFEKASAEEVEEYEGHKSFMANIQRLINIMEEWDADRPSTANRYRYSAQDIMNVTSMLLNNKPIEGLKTAKDQKSETKKNGRTDKN